MSESGPPNHRKQEVLQILRAEGPCKTGVLVERTGTSRSNIHNVLRRLRRQRRVESEGGGPTLGQGGEEKTHSITSRGEDLLDYYEE